MTCQPPFSQNTNQTDSEVRVELVFNASPEAKQVLKRVCLILSHLLTAALTTLAVNSPTAVQNISDPMAPALPEVTATESLTRPQASIPQP